jgi:hypothetical protein
MTSLDKNVIPIKRKKFATLFFPYAPHKNVFSELTGAVTDAQ